MRLEPAVRAAIVASTDSPSGTVRRCAGTIPSTRSWWLTRRIDWNHCRVDTEVDPYPMKTVPIVTADQWWNHAWGVGADRRVRPVADRECSNAHAIHR